LLVEGGVEEVGLFAGEIVPDAIDEVEQAWSAGRASC